MNATFIVSVWIVLGTATLFLAIYPRVLATHKEEDALRLGPGEEGEIAKQTSLAHRRTAIRPLGHPHDRHHRGHRLGACQRVSVPSLGKPQPGT